MDTNLASDRGRIFYDPFLYGFNTDFFHTFSGGTIDQADNGKIRISAGSVGTNAMIMGGKGVFKINIPTIPTAGDNRYIGFYSRAYGNKNAAYFFVIVI